MQQHAVKMRATKKLAEDIRFIERMVAQNGPDPADYRELNAWFDQIGQKSESQEYSEAEIDLLRAQFREVYLTSKTLPGFVHTQPHGYRGDFEIIDKIYQEYCSSDKSLYKWYRWFHAQQATRAVRNRKTYFKKLLGKKNADGQPVEVLNLASGPCRDLAEFFTEYPTAEVKFDCVEIDPNAVEYAKKLLGTNVKNVNFMLANIFRFKPSKRYDLIWSAGLFDYFDDRVFVSILKRYKESMKPAGEIVIGNFHPSNSTKRIMEFASWCLNHRTETTLLSLAEQAGFDQENIVIDQESEGVNLFMRIKRKPGSPRPGSFAPE